jgi:hypothetical protein
MCLLDAKSKDAQQFSKSTSCSDDVAKNLPDKFCEENEDVLLTCRREGVIRRKAVESIRQTNSSRSGSGTHNSYWQV